MPTGLDGNPDPITSEARSAVLERLAGLIAARPRTSILRVAVDGIDGAGKTTFADELGAALERRGVAVIRSTTDSFHNPRAVRHRRGKRSPEGFYRDSHDLELLETCLLDPLSATPPLPFRRAGFDEPSDTRVDAVVEHAAPGAVLLFDGLFLMRAELRGYWDYVIYVDGETRVRDERVALASETCPPGPAAFPHLAAWWAVLSRYVDGQRLYISECSPRERAHAVVDNNELARPTLLVREPRRGSSVDAG